MTHGLRSSYNVCRCPDCCEANRLYLQDYRKRVRGTEPPEHGTRAGYVVYGCPCDDCRTAAMDYQRDWRKNAA